MDELFGVEGWTLAYYGNMPNSKAEALELSIRKWQVLLELAEGGRKIDDGATETCGLCQWHFVFGIKWCEDCPVQIKTGRPGCNGTPYVDYHNADGPEEAADAARLEIEFLEGLDV